jgi:Holliday junction resolvase RusA-like endonuclease
MNWWRWLKENSMRIEINAISVNHCWQGKRFKTKEYTDWRRGFGLLYASKTPKIACIGEKLGLCVVFHINTPKRADLDNMLKPLLDACVENGIIKDDRFVYEIRAKKEKAEDEEYIDFEFYEIK